MNTEEVYIERYECTVKIALDLDNRDIMNECLNDYYKACTTRIIGLAGEECGRIGYHQDNDFDKYDIMDPDFGESDFDESLPTLAQFLERMCNDNILAIINAMDMMEKSWKTRKPYKSSVSKTLWEFVNEDACHHVNTLYGEHKEKEFRHMGDKLFGIE